MNYIQRKMFALVAAAVFAVVYYPLKDFAFALDLAVCASYTVTVFIKVRGKRGRAGLFTGEDAIPLAELMLVHLLALAGIVGVVRLGIYAAPVLPGWLTAPIGSTPAGRPLPSPLRYFQTGMLPHRIHRILVADADQNRRGEGKTEKGDLGKRRLRRGDESAASSLNGGGGG